MNSNSKERYLATSILRNFSMAYTQSSGLKPSPSQSKLPVHGGSRSFGGREIVAATENEASRSHNLATKGRRGREWKVVMICRGSGFDMHRAGATILSPWVHRYLNAGSRAFWQRLLMKRLGRIPDQAVRDICASVQREPCALGKITIHCPRQLDDGPGISRFR